jgi:hypothetical protein
MPSPIAECPEARGYKIKHLYNFSVLVPWPWWLCDLPTPAKELLYSTEYPVARGCTIQHFYKFSVLSHTPMVVVLMFALCNTSNGIYSGSSKLKELMHYIILN